MKKAILSVILSVLMVATMIPSVSFAGVDIDNVAKNVETGVEYGTVQAAINAAASGQTVQMIADSTENVTVGTSTDRSKIVTLDLNGKTLKSTEITEGARHNAITNYAILTIADSSEDKTGKITGGIGASAGKSSIGGGVYNTGGILTITGGTITGNSASLGGGVANVENGTFNMSGGTITGNTTSKMGGGVYNDGTMKGSGTAKITGNTKVVEETSTANNVYLPSGKTITVGTGSGDDVKYLENGSSIGVTTADTPTKGNPVNITGANGTNDYSEYFTSDNAAYDIVENGTKTELVVASGIPVAKITKGDVTKKFDTVQKAINFASKGDTVVMIADSMENVTVASGTNITLDLNGKVLYSAAAGNDFSHEDSVIENNGTLTIIDSGINKSNYFTYYEHSDDYNGAWKYLPNHEASESDVAFEDINSSELTSGVSVIAVKGGCITGGTGTYISENNCEFGGGIYNLNELTVNAGNIIGNYARGGGGVYCDAGKTFTMNGGTIAGNTFNGVEVSGTMEMKGGLISNNFSNTYGGGVSVDAGGKLNIKGSSTSMPQIRYNNADCGGGISVGSSEEKVGELSICGNAVISNNQAVEGGGIYLEGALDNDGKLINYAVLNMSSNENNKPQIKQNKTTSYQGGGICLVNASMTSTGGRIVDNIAEGSGGGVFVDKMSECSISNTEISNNKAAVSGGGINVGGEAGCFIEGTKITMADGSVKNIEDVKNGEKIRTFDHETGKLSAETVVYKFAGEGKSTAMMLHFEDDIELGVVGSHGLLEKDTKKYVALSASNAEDYIGKYFYNADSAKWGKLLSVSYTSKAYNYYALYSAHHINAIANHMISVTDDATFRLNAFDFDENLKVNQAKKQQDIEKYGLTEYEDFKDVIDEESFYNFNNQYDHIAVCKGLITREEILELAANTTNDNNATLQGDKEPLMFLTSTLLGGSGPSASLTIGADVEISGNTIGEDEEKSKSNVYIESDKYIKLDGANNTTPISLKMSDPGYGQFTTNGSSDDAKYFSSEDETYYVKYSTNHLELAVENVKIDKNITNGKISVDNQDAGAGKPVDVTVTPDNGYELDKITIKDKDGEDITATVLNGTTITMPAEEKMPITVSATFKKKASPTPPTPTPEEPTPTPTPEEPTPEAPAKDLFIASGTAKGSTNAIKWNAFEGADGYDVYFAHCGDAYKKVKSTTALKYTKTGLNTKKVYKYKVKAYKLVDGKKTYLATTATIHIAGTASKYSNATKISVNSTDLSLASGETAKLGAKIAKKSNAKAVLWKNHVSAKVRYMSSDKSVATVDKNGKLKAVGKGEAYVYAYAANGVYAKVKISVTGDLGAVWIG